MATIVADETDVTPVSPESPSLCPTCHMPSLVDAETWLGYQLPVCAHHTVVSPLDCRSCGLPFVESEHRTLTIPEARRMNECLTRGWHHPLPLSG